MNYKCTNCDWEGEDPVRNDEARLDIKCPKCGDEIKMSEPKAKVKSKPSIAKRLKDIKEDLLDDGKLNHSNNPKKKSPGRKPKAKRGNKR